MKNWFDIWRKVATLQYTKSMRRARYPTPLKLCRLWLSALPELAVMVVAALFAFVVIAFSPLIFILGITKRYWWPIWVRVDSALVAAKWIRNCFKEGWALEYAQEYVAKCSARVNDGEGSP